jgi:hypothetical protein
MEIENMNFIDETLQCNKQSQELNLLDINANGHAGAYSNTNDHRFEITLSVSRDAVRSKAEGGKITAFETITINTRDEDKLRKILTGRNYSTNVWNGTCSNQNYIGMTGVILDFDGTLSIDDARDLFYGYHYIMHTSASHRVKQPVGDRFRVILPFAPGALRFTTPEECKKVYRRLLNLYPQADAACVDPGRKYFPHTNELGAEFILDVNDCGQYFDIDVNGETEDEVRDFEPRNWNGVLQPKSELDRVVKFCPFIRWMEAHIDDPTVHISEPLKFCYVSNLCWFDGGSERIHAMLSRDVRPEKYDRDVIEDKIERVRQIGPHTYAKIADLSKGNAELWGWPGDEWDGPASPAGWAKFGRIANRNPLHKSGDIYIQYDDKLVHRVGNAWQTTNLDHLKAVLRKGTKMLGICPFCDADNAEWANDTFHFTYLWCPQCQKRYYEHPDSPGLFALKGDLMRIETRSDKFVSIEPLQKENFHTPEDWNFIRRLVLNDPDRRYLSEDFQIRRIGSVDFEHIGFEFDVNENAIVYKYPARPVVVQDNAFIDAFLDGLFGPYAEFIKNWMAMYCYTNYVKLPVIVLAGERFSGKNTFAEMMGKIFPNLMGYWDGDVCEFNPQFTSKLLFVDENRNATKPEQYVELKRITGNELIPINRKHKDVFYARNNLNIIFATNDARPVALKWGEEPTDERVNNFFIHWCTSTKVIDNELKFKLWDRIGYYVRTELRDRYEQLIANTDTRNRYFLAAPITDYARTLYASSKNSVEEETEVLAECIVRGVVPRDPLDEPQPGDKSLPNFKPVKRPDKEEYHIPPRKLMTLIKAMKLTASRDLKAYQNALVRMKIISPEEYRVDKKRYGYPILRPRSDYPEDGPVIWDD